MSSQYAVYEEKMRKTLEVLKHEFTTIRTGRPSAAVLDKVTVDYYGAMTPIQQLANISSPDAHSLLITPYDNSVLKGVEKAYTVRCSTPSSAKIVAALWNVSLPAEWPAFRGKPRFWAQRPLPSITMAMCRGIFCGSSGTCFSFFPNKILHILSQSNRAPFERPAGGGIPPAPPKHQISSSSFSFFSHSASTSLTILSVRFWMSFSATL